MSSRDRRVWKPEPEARNPSFLLRPGVLMLLGVALMAGMGYLLFIGSAAEREYRQAAAQGERAAAQVSQAVQGFLALLRDEQTQALARMAAGDRAKLEELRGHLAGRVPELREVRLYDEKIYLSETALLGESAFVILDMVMAARRDGISPAQMLMLDGQPGVGGVVALNGEDGAVGFMLVVLEPEVVTAQFNMTLPKAGYIGLEQSNGRFAANDIKHFGDRERIERGTLRLPVASSLFKVVIPKSGQSALFGGIPRLVAFLFGAGLLAAGLIRSRRRTRRELPLTDTEPDVPVPAPEASDAEFSTADRAAPAAGAVQAPLPVVSLSDLSFDADERRRERSAAAEPVALDASIFRAYDIRGVVGETLDAGIARQIGQAVGSLALERGAGPVVVGRDGRHSGPDLAAGLVAGISSTGCDAIVIGAVPTGVLYFAAHEAGSGSGVMVTGSHNPPDYNGFKIMVGGATLAGEDIEDLHRRLQAGDLRTGEGGVERRSVLGAYRDRIAGDIQLARPLKVVADCGNGIGGVSAAEVLRSIGAEVLPLFDEVDGTFPNHHPDPSEPENLADLIESVQLMNADLGVAFDGDADRLGVVTPAGEIVFADRLMMLFAREILARNPGARIIYDVKCTGHLDTVIREAGGEPEMWKTGHSLIKNRMRETGAPFAGEMSGHFFFKDRWYGFDCGIYSAARLLEILALDERPPQQVLASLPNSVSTPELKVPMQEGQNHAFVREFQQRARFEGARLSTIDGVRADFPEGWGLCRASNTTPVLVLRFDADSAAALEAIQEAFREQMLALDPGLELPF